MPNKTNSSHPRGTGTNAEERSVSNPRPNKQTAPTPPKGK